MTISDLFNELANKDFQDPATGNLFFPAYIFAYAPEEEYMIRREIEELKDRLIRPDNYVDCLIMNIFNEFVEFLKSQTVAKQPLFDQIVDEEEKEPQEMYDLLIEKAHSNAFLNFIHEQTARHFSNQGKFERVYLMIHGFGTIFPYLRTSEFLKNYESFLSGADYKLITFFPGKYENGNYQLFGQFHDENIYRATLINN